MMTVWTIVLAVWSAFLTANLLRVKDDIMTLNMLHENHQRVLESHQDALEDDGAHFSLGERMDLAEPGPELDRLIYGRNFSKILNLSNDWPPGSSR
jgi:hypothetical protein